MTPSFNLRARTNATFRFTRDLSQWAEVYNLSAAVLRMQLRKTTSDDEPAYEFSTTNGRIAIDAATHICTIRAPEADVAGLAGRFVYDVRAEFQGGAVVVLFGGTITFVAGITRTLGDDANTSTALASDTVDVVGEVSSTPIPLAASESAALSIAISARNAIQNNGYANILDFYAGGTHTAAMTAALATGLPVAIPYNGGDEYSIDATFTLAAGTHIFGLGGTPTIRQTGRSSRLFTISTENVWIDDLNIITNAGTLYDSVIVFTGSGVTSGGCRRVKMENPRKNGFRIEAGASGVIISDWTSINSTGNGVTIDGVDTTGNTITRGFVKNSGSFGIYLVNGANRNEISFNRTYINGCELIGVTYDCWGNRVIGNHAETCDDHGISITGFNNSIVGNYCINNYGNGIGIFGSNNAVVGNVCRNNGRAYLNDYIGAGTVFSGILMEPSWGGSGSNNTIIGNECSDNQSIPTQSYGVWAKTMGYVLWRPNTVISGYAYYRYGNNVYKAIQFGTTGNTPPTETGGSITDGTVIWKYLYTGTPDLNANGNKIADNVCVGNRLLDVYNPPECKNSISTGSYLQKENGNKIVFSSGSTSAVSGSLGDLLLNALDGRPKYYSGFEWVTLGAPLSGSTPGRPLAAAVPGQIYLNTTTGVPEFSINGNWVLSDGTILSDGAALNYDYTSARYEESGASVLFSARHADTRSSSADLRAEYPLTAISTVSANTARIDSRGLLNEAQAINYFLNSTSPSTQTITLSDGKYAVDVIGPGSVTLSGGASGVVTDQNPINFTLATTSAVAVTISGTLYHVNVVDIAHTLITGSGPYISQPVKSTSSVGSRSNEAIYVNVSDLGIVGQFTFAAVLKAPAYSFSSGVFIGFSDASGDNFVYLRNKASSKTLVFIPTFGTQSSKYADTAFDCSSQTFCVAGSVSGNSVSISINGGSVISATASSGSFANVTLDHVTLGSGNGGSNAQGVFIQKLVLFGSAANNAVLMQYSQASYWT